ncbi:hypothetical protein Tco_1540358 [Tanacetum coccineum]
MQKNLALIAKYFKKIYKPTNNNLITSSNSINRNVDTSLSQHSEQPEFINNTCVVEKVDSNVIFDSSDMCNDDIQTDQNAKECDDERQVKKANASLTHELKECKSILAETSRTLEESNSTRDSCLIALQGKQTELETYKTLNDRTTDYDELESPKGSTFNGRPTFANPMYLKKAQSEKPCLYEIPYDISDPANRFVPDREETMTLEKENR